MIEWQLAIAGLTAGGAYALSALGVVVIHRGSGVLNFAQGAIGLIAVYLFWTLYNDHAVPLIPALIAGATSGALVGVLFYLIAVRNLHNASDATKAVATLGLLLAVSSLAAKVYGTDLTLVPGLFGTGSLTVFGAVVTQGTLVVLAVTVVAALTLALIVRLTRFGIVSTALLENPRVVVSVGISPTPTALASWAIGGVLGALAGILLLPVTGLSSTNITLLVVPSMGAALVARFRSLSVTVIAGLAIGVVQSILTFHVDVSLVQTVPFLIIVAVLVIRGKGLPGRGSESQLRIPKVGRDALRWPTAVMVAVASIALTVLVSGSWLDALINSMLVMLLAFSVIIVTGFAGQLSLAPFALAGIGALVTAHASYSWNLSFLPAVVVGTVATGIFGLVLGAPAVRVRGIHLGIATLGLGLAVSQGILGNPRFTGGSSGITIEPPSLLGWSIDPGGHPKRYALVVLVVVLLAALCVGNIRRGESGRRYLAVRGNERGAAAVGISVMGAKLGSFAISSMFAGLAGALTIYRFQFGSFDNFTVLASVTLLGFVIVGGVGFIGGAVAAGLATPGGAVSHLLMDTLGLSWADAWLPILGGLAMIDVAVRYPDGLAPVFGKLKDVALRVIPGGRRGDGTPHASIVLGPSEAHRSDEELVDDHSLRRRSAERGPIGLEVRGLTVRYGSVVAVDAVDLSIARGRVLGVIGPNGAGKTTLIDAITGFAVPETGTVQVEGRQLDKLGPRRRARRGLGRTFQNLELSEDLTVEENILSALDRGRIGAYFTDLFWPRRPRLNPRSAELVRLLGLECDMQMVASDLPNGRRRLVAVARMAVREPTVMCLDEPAAGLSAAERVELSRVLRLLAEEFDAAVLLVEHNIDVVADSCDDLLALDFGRPIATGATADVLASDAVRRAYLGETVDADRPASSQHPDPEVLVSLGNAGEEA